MCCSGASSFPSAWVDARRASPSASMTPSSAPRFAVSPALSSPSSSCWRALLTAAAWAQVAIGLRPLAAMRGKLAAIGSGEARRLGSDFPDEVLPLAHEIDTLLDARERQVEKARTRAADLAHGLKTPLQLLSSDAERLRAKGEDELAEEIDDIADSMRRHVERELVRARSGANAANASASVAAVAQRVVRVVERTPHGRRVAWTVDVPPGLHGAHRRRGS